MFQKSAQQKWAYYSGWEWDRNIKLEKLGTSEECYIGIL